MKKFYFLCLLSLTISINVNGQRQHFKRQKTEKINNQINYKRNNIDNKLLNFRQKNKRSNFQKSKINSSNLISSPLVIKNRLDYTLYQSWDETLSQYLDDYKDEFTYDSNGNNTQGNEYYWDGSQWVNYGKYEYTYDSNGNLTQEIDYYLDASQWVNGWKYEYTYDTNGKLTQEIDYSWDGSQWVNEWKAEYTYNTNGNLTQEIEYYWDASQWVIYLKYEYTYDTNGKLTQEIDYYWDGSQWVINGGKYEYTYDTNGNLTQEIDYSWDVSQWVNYGKYEYTYDTNGNLTQEIDYSWDGSQWVNYGWKYEYTYNNSYSFSDLILPYWYSDIVVEKYFNHMLTNMIAYMWDETLNDWILDEKMTFFYSEQDVLSISDIIEEQLKIYPNPVSNILSIDSEIIPINKVEIYSVLGKKVKEVNSDFNSIRTNNLSNGVYIFKIYSENGIATKKLIKK